MLKKLVAFIIIITAGATHAEEIEIHEGGMLLPITTQCTNPSTDMTNMVMDKYSEIAFAEGQAAVQYAKTGEWVHVPFTLYVNPDALTWSMIAFMPSGPGCLISSGEGFIPAVNTTY
jgi:hypothetical protein